MADKLELTWCGKGKRILAEPRILIERPELSRRARPPRQRDLFPAARGAPADDNLLIHGDNLLALKAIEARFAGRIKCVYIDPPYNTGAAFEHYDDNLEHSQWLNLMRPRLELIRNLLADNGSLWISIDDDEQAYLKVLCDEIFGRRNFVANIVWQKRTSPDMRAVISDGHDFILLYVKDRERFKQARNKLPLSDEQTASYKNLDNDPRGVWSSVDITGQTGHATPSQFYEITTPDGTKYRPPEGRCWAMSEETFHALAEDKRIWFGKDGSSRPRKKLFLSEAGGVVPWTWWTNREVGHNQEAKKEINLLFGNDNPFDTPKPERLLRRIIQIATNPGDWVLDSFLGSGTTAAVAHKMGRRWIGIEMGKHAYTHCKARLDKVVDGTDGGGVTRAVGWNGGGGYLFCELAPTLINKDPFGEPVINPEYGPDMLAAAVALHEGFEYRPDPAVFWKQAANGDKSFLFTTTRHVTAAYAAAIRGAMAEDEHLVIACRSFDAGLDAAAGGIDVKKIPRLLLEQCRCEFGRDDYRLNIVCPPALDAEEEGDGAAGAEGGRP